MNLPNDEIIFVTEASDEFLHLTRTCIYTFTKENTWFDGTILLLTHKSIPFSNKSMLQLKKVYDKIEIKVIDDNPIIDYIISSNPRFGKDSSLLLDILKFSLFELPNKILYSSYYSVFLKQVSLMLIEDSMAIHRRGLSIFYKDSSIIFDNNQMLDIISEISAPITSTSLEQTFTDLIAANEVESILPEHMLILSTTITDKKYNQLSPKLKSASVVLFNSIKNKSTLYSKIDRLWQFLNKSSTKSINRPVYYTNKEVTAMRNRLKTVASNKRRKQNYRLPKPSAPKLGATYIVFDGVELLESSISCIRESVDFICVVYQKTSWFGAKIKKEDLDELHELKSRGLIDSLIEFSSFAPIYGASTKSKISKAKGYETAKRDASLNECLKNGCTHYICLDVDEFYDPETFKEAKEYIYDNEVHYSACKYLNYVTPTLHRGLSAMYVPFICRITKTSRNGKRFFVRTDPTRGVYTAHAVKTMAFNSNKIIMHHMETVRKDIYRKYESTTRLNLNRSKIKELSHIIDSVDDSQSNIRFNRIIYEASREFKLIKTKNKFNIRYTEW